MDENRIYLHGIWTRSIGGRVIDTVQVPSGYPPVGECDLAYTFVIPEEWLSDNNRRLFLCVEGVLASGAFTINGVLVGTAGPWIPYRFELPKGLLAARNEINVHIHDITDEFGPTPGRRFDAGIIRDIYIESRPQVYLEDFHFRAVLDEACSKATCTVAIEVCGNDDATATVMLAEKDGGRVIAKASASSRAPAVFEVDRPGLWSPASPRLYRITVTLDDEDKDSLTELVGFRRIDVRGQDFYLNNQRLILKGVCRHEFTSASGYSPSYEEVRYELSLIKHAGFNYIRLVHSPQAACVCRIAAELGILVSEEPGTCFHDLGDEKIYTPALKCLQGMVKRDRNVPSIFAWLIYNECNPNTEYAVRAAKICRQLDSGCRLGMADCSGRDDDIKEMVSAADLTFYGINVYAFTPAQYVSKMEVFRDRPLVITEWGGYLLQGNPRLLKTVCDSFVRHTREHEQLRIAGCSFWVWADYEEHSRVDGAALRGWTVEGLLDEKGEPKQDLLTLSMMCFDMDHPKPEYRPKIELMARSPKRRENWTPVMLDRVPGDQSRLEQAIDEARRRYTMSAPWIDKHMPEERKPPRIGRVLADGIEFICRDMTAPSHPLLLGRGREELFIEIGRWVEGVAVLGHVALMGGYPASGVYSVHHRDAEPVKEFGSEASEYEFVFEDGTDTQPLRHGIEILRSNNICRWWTPDPCSPQTKPALQVLVDVRFEQLRIDLWEKRFDKPRFLKGIRWRLKDTASIQAMFALSVLDAGLK